MRPHKTTIYIHLICIFAFLSIPAFTSPEGMLSPKLLHSPFFMREMFGYVLCVGFFYLNFYYLSDRFFFTKKYTIYVLLVVSCLLVVIALPNLLFQPYIPMRKEIPFPGRNDHFVFFNFMHYEHDALKFLFVFFLSHTIKNNLRYQQTVLEKAETELSFLKAQINPHFFFNSLNTIYSFSIEKSDKTPAAVLQLADLMRYVIYEADKKWVPLQKEIAYLKNYISLQESRLGETVQVDFKEEGDVSRQMIAPLILMPFVENAFKYGVDTNQDKNVISIHLAIEENKLYFSVKNKIAQAIQPHEKEKGIGLENTINRLRLLYPSTHVIQVSEERNEYSVILKMNLL